LFGGLATTVAHNPSFFPFLVSLLFAISSNKYYSKSLAISSKKNSSQVYIETAMGFF
jgi:hypothetical protein